MEVCDVNYSLLLVIRDKKDLFWNCYENGNLYCYHPFHDTYMCSHFKDNRERFKNPQFLKKLIDKY